MCLYMCLHRVNITLLHVKCENIGIKKGTYPIPPPVFYCIAVIYKVHLYTYIMYIYTYLKHHQTILYCLT